MAKNTFAANLTFKTYHQKSNKIIINWKRYVQIS